MERAVSLIAVEFLEADLASVCQASLDDGLSVVPGECVKRDGYPYHPEIENLRKCLAEEGLGLCHSH